MLLYQQIFSEFNLSLHLEYGCKCYYKKSQTQTNSAQIDTADHPKKQKSYRFTTRYTPTKD